MAKENPIWGAPRIHGELLKLGFNVCERSVSRYLAKISPEPSGNKIKKWMSFLENQRKGIAAMDFFIVSTLFFKRLYCFFIIDHNRRRILHFNVTFHPTALWVSKQIQSAFSSIKTPKYIILDHDKICSALVTMTLQSLGITPIRTSIRSPQFLAKRYCWTLDWKLSQGVARSCDYSQSKPLVQAAGGIHWILPSRPDTLPSWQRPTRKSPGSE